MSKMSKNIFYFILTNTYKICMPQKKLLNCTDCSGQLKFGPVHEIDWNVQ